MHEKYDLDLTINEIKRVTSKRHRKLPVAIIIVSPAVTSHVQHIRNN